MGVPLRASSGCLRPPLQQPPLVLRRAVRQPPGAGSGGVAGASLDYPQGHGGHGPPPPGHA
eukprot:3794798-Alexandrium_andersonii.AAC.1